MLEATFTDSSTDADGEVVAWGWDLGDGTTATDQNLVHTYAANGTYTVTRTVTDNEGATGSTSQSVTVNDGTGSETMHIESITTVVARASGSGTVEATVLIHDESGSPVQDVSVTGLFSGDLSGTDTGVTDVNGEAVLISDSFTTRPSLLNVCAEDVSHTSLVYDPAQNSDASFDCATAAVSGAAQRNDFLQIEQVPETFSLAQNYPNPFNPVTEVAFQLPVAERAKLEVFDVLGRRVAVLVDQELAAGAHAYSFDANSLPNGTYFYKLTAGFFTSTRSMILLK